MKKSATEWGSETNQLRTSKTREIMRKLPDYQKQSPLNQITKYKAYDS